MDSKYTVNREGSTNGVVSKFKGFQKGVYKPLLLSLKQRKKFKNSVANTNGSSLNGKLTTIKNSPLVKPVGKPGLIKDIATTTQLLKQRKQLPVFQHKDRIIAEIARNECLVFLGETGSGKTTQIPQYIHECGYLLKTGICAVTQPRRMAAITIAQRVSLEQHCQLGQEVGYTVRFEDMTSDRTKIQYMTDGTLFRQALNDRLLTKYSVIVLDEAHERTINTDVLFGLVKAAQAARKQKGLPLLRIIMMSATMDADHFANYFNGCNVIYLEGRLFPVKVWHMKESTRNMDYEEICLHTLFNIHMTEPLSEDVLVFLTGQDEVENMAASIKTILQYDQYKDRGMKVLPLYAQLPQSKQLEVLKSTGKHVRKVILSTNIAETSITIPEIKFVIDSGRVKQKNFNPGTQVESLKVCKISQAQAWQRTGRAGRESAGTCYRTYTIAEFRKMPRMTVPEIVRSDLGTAVLQLLAMGIDSATFDFMDKPNAELVDSAFRLLFNVKAIDGLQTRLLTEAGAKMARFPLEPRLSRSLLASAEMGCLEDMLSVVALLSSENIFLSTADKPDAMNAHRKFQSSYGDVITLLNVFKAFQGANSAQSFCYTNYLNLRNLSYAVDVRKQLEAICRKCKLKTASLGESPPPVKKLNGETAEKEQDWANVRKCLLIAYFDNVAQLQRDNTYMTLSHRQRAKIHPSSVLNGKSRPELLFYTELLSTAQNYLKMNTVAEAKWLVEMPQLRKHFRNFLEK